MKPPKYVSASPCTTTLKCPRAAVLDGLGLKSGSTKAQARGTQLHEAVEAYLLGETEVVEDDLGDFARTNGLLPEPNTPGMLVEFGLGEPNEDAARYAAVDNWTGEPIIVHGVPFRGLVDLTLVTEDGVEIWDHKTCASFYWAETQETLRQNLQIWAYAYQMTHYLDRKGELPDAPVTLGHIQYQKKKYPRPDDVRAVEFTTSLAMIERKWALIEDVIATYIEEFQRPIIDTHRLTSHCGAYGGCKFRAYCDQLGTRDISSNTVRALRRWRNSF